jgi:hypothetical protein
MYVHATFAGITHIRFVRDDQQAQLVIDTLHATFGPIEVTVVRRAA